MRILIVEDDDRVAGALEAFLARSGYATVRAADGAAALELLGADTEVVLLDLGLPDVDGIDLCRRIRGRSEVPIVIVTARNQVAERIKGLRAGADDFVVKPYDVHELLARIEAVTRRSRPIRPESDARVLLHGGELQIDLVARQLSVDGVPIDLTRKEFDIIAVLARYPGVAVPKERLIREVWNTDWRGFGHSLEVHVGAIRKKSGARGLIETVRGVGYRLAGS
ncbi:response regulator transcription factor [Microbacterium aurugineum]|uniref:Sensory transduction protein RegX3 n=1 Tax=Microbacterium aurugineum TaxID=2851642 RepID=A0ABY4IZ57_9MICO|nr:MULTISPECIES: response regulator transcription factor [Microbacterium]MCK8468052.1 response regulator transcription factor [Microbacterium aurugineum]MCZ4301307.1 response regulator transcription factor [Microbacterium oxydans]QEA30129.1 response regulator transcription factor [Microbacterium sp. CBA3102]TCJ23079.1 response regulator transcription factor [Microbacterium sp. PI-1]TFB15405.1 response regulator transcription factor [Microbacterium sp. 3H14]